MLINQFGQDPKLIHVIGHSLGAQTAGAIGRDYVKRTKGNKIDSIVSLDAASPNFDSFKIKFNLMFQCSSQ